MGIRDKLIGRVKRVVERLNGDFSAVAPEQTQDYDKPGVPNEDAKVVMARLPRPVVGAKRPSADEEG